MCKKRSRSNAIFPVLEGSELEDANSNREGVKKESKHLLAFGDDLEIFDPLSEEDVNKSININ